ncbi:MAG: Kdo hydroxylase family protein [Gammaproteobacteria bacterium]
MSRLEEFAKSRWDEPLPAAALPAAITALETGKVLYFPKLAFTFAPSEQKFLTIDGLNLKAKNISFNPNNGTLKNFHCHEMNKNALKQLLQRYAKYARQLLAELFPQYTASLQLGRTSFRPAKIEGRKLSYRKDDTRLHVDAFPATPNQGQRILRVFTNVNPNLPRIWRLGEPFPQVVQTFSPHLKAPLYGSAKLLQLLKLTRGYRTLYDHYMLQLHNAMKADLAYQKSANQQEICFPAGSTWVVYTDLVSHAAMKGEFALEQTFYLPVHAMQDEYRSPLRVLEKVLSQKLVPVSALSYAS